MTTKSGVNPTQMLVVYVWIDVETKQIVDAGLYTDKIPKAPAGMAGAILGVIEGSASSLVENLANGTLLDGCQWTSTFPTMSWQIAWASCSCYGSPMPMPPNPDLAPVGSPLAFGADEEEEDGDGDEQHEDG
jgi:hypothetical protein